MQTSGELLAAAPGKSARTRRRWPWVTVVVVFVVLYAGLVTAYAISGANAVVDQPAKEIPAGGAGVILTARSIDAAIPEMDMDVQLDLDDSLLDDAGAPLQPITLTLGPTQEDVDLTYGTDHRPQVRQVKMLFDGDIENWPFDSYQSAIYAQLSQGQGQAQRSIPTVVIVDGDVQGWSLAAATDPDEPDLSST